MIREFEGKTKEEAIAIAMDELGLHEDELDVEILNTKKMGLFKKGPVRIRVFVTDEEGSPPQERSRPLAQVNSEMESHLIEFLTTILDKMGFVCRIAVIGREPGKVLLDIQSPDVNLLIGKHGKNLDALQIFANIFVARLLENTDESLKVVLDAEDYRIRREGQIVRMARKAAQQVRQTHMPQLLEPMNPFERRIIHTTLSDMHDIRTESEGGGLIKQVRVSFVENM